MLALWILVGGVIIVTLFEIISLLNDPDYDPLDTILNTYDEHDEEKDDG